MTKVLELDGRIIKVHEKKFEINGNIVIAQGDIEVITLPLYVEAIQPQTKPEKNKQQSEQLGA